MRDALSSAELRLFAVSPPGLELLVAAELEQLGCAATVGNGGAEWTGTLQQLRQANLWLRVASRVLVRVGSFRARTFFELERHAARVEWNWFLSAGVPVELRISSRKSKLYHEGAIAERLTRAIVSATGARVQTSPSGSSDDHEETSAQLFVVRVLRDEFTISADSSGAHLHRRGYRQETAKAPLRETLAAALLSAAGWQGDGSLLDPFCGSGTIAIEAALRARNIAPGLARATRQPRSFAFERWPGHDTPEWQREVARARAQMRDASAAIFASDRDAGAIRAAIANAVRAGVQDDITFTVAPLSTAPAPAGPGTLVSNPPYGMRVRGGRDLRDLYAALGAYVRERLDGWRIVLLSADPAIGRQLGLPMHSLAETTNGGIPVVILAGDNR